MQQNLVRSAVAKLKAVLRGAVLFWRMRQRSVLILGERLWISTKIKRVLRGDIGDTTLRSTRDVRVRVGGKSAFRRIRKLIRRATTSIIVQTFIWKNDETGRRIAALLLAAAKRGVSIHIIKESVGDFFEFDAAFAETKNSNDPLWTAFWREPNIVVRFSENADHSKVWIIDGYVVLLSGMNIGNEYEHEWHDFLVELRGERYAREVLVRRASSDTSGDAAAIILNDAAARDIRPCAEELINGAKKRIIVEHCHLTDEGILAALAEATKRNVACTIITPIDSDLYVLPNIAALRTLRNMSNTRNLRLLQYPKMFHAKVLCVDDNRCLLGSANFNSLSLDRTGEICVLLRGESRVVRKIHRQLTIDMLKSRMYAIPRLALFSRLLRLLGV